MADYEHKIRQYQHARVQKKLFRSDDLSAEAKEILETYRQAIVAGYKLTEDDDKIRFEAIIIENPHMLEQLITRIESDDIVDEHGNHAPELGGES